MRNKDNIRLKKSAKLADFFNEMILKKSNLKTLIVDFLTSY